MEISGSVSIPFPKWDKSKHEIVYAVFGPDTRLEYDISVSFDIAFDEVEIVGGQPAIAVLKQLAGIVERILLSLETDTRRLGYV